jgi:hypothetical protein
MMKKRDFMRLTDFCKRMVFSGVLRSKLTDHRKQRLWEEIESFLYAHQGEPIDGWDNDYCLCDDFREHFAEYINDIWVESDGWQKENPRYFVNQLEIVVRSGLDFVFDDQGVIGFTVGDLRKMYDGKVPRWITRRYIPGFSKAPDYTAIWF